jgi:hypothetical protein
MANATAPPRQKKPARLTNAWIDANVDGATWVDGLGMGLGRSQTGRVRILLRSRRRI